MGLKKKKRPRRGNNFLEIGQSARLLVIRIINSIPVRSGGSYIRAAELQHPLSFFYAPFFLFSLPFKVLSPNFLNFHISFHVLIKYEYKFINGIPVLSAARGFSYANEPNGDATKAIDDVFALAVLFLYELLCWQIKGNSD